MILSLLNTIEAALTSHAYKVGRGQLNYARINSFTLLQRKSFTFEPSVLVFDTRLIFLAFRRFAAWNKTKCCGVCRFNFYLAFSSRKNVNSSKYYPNAH